MADHVREILGRRGLVQRLLPKVAELHRGRRLAPLPSQSEGTAPCTDCQPCCLGLPEGCMPVWAPAPDRELINDTWSLVAEYVSTAAFVLAGWQWVGTGNGPRLLRGGSGGFVGQRGMSVDSVIIFTVITTFQIACFGRIQIFFGVSSRTSLCLIIKSNTTLRQTQKRVTTHAKL